MSIVWDLAVTALAGAGLSYFVGQESIGGHLGLLYWSLNDAVGLILSKSALCWAASAVLGLVAAVRLLRSISARRRRSEGSGESKVAETELEPRDSTATQAEQSGAAAGSTAPPLRRVSLHERTVHPPTQTFECPRTFERAWTRELRVKPVPAATSRPAHTAPSTPSQRPDRRSVIEAYKRDPYALDSLAELLRDSVPAAVHADSHWRRAKTHPFTPIRTS